MIASNDSFVDIYLRNHCSCPLLDYCDIDASFWCQSLDKKLAALESDIPESRGILD